MEEVLEEMMDVLTDALPEDWQQFILVGHLEDEEWGDVTARVLFQGKHYDLYSEKYSDSVGLTLDAMEVSDIIDFALSLAFPYMVKDPVGFGLVINDEGEFEISYFSATDFLDETTSNWVRNHEVIE